MLDQKLNKNSGVESICGTADFQYITDTMMTDSNCQLAFDMTVHRILHYIGGYYIHLGGLDALIFGGGVGENSRKLRKAIVLSLSCIGALLDEKLNDVSVDDNVFINGIHKISAKESKFQILVVKTDEEGEIASYIKQQNIL